MTRNDRCLLLVFSVWTCVSVSGVRVPPEWQAYNENFGSSWQQGNLNNAKANPKQKLLYPESNTQSLNQPGVYSLPAIKPLPTLISAPIIEDPGLSSDHRFNLRPAGSKLQELTATYAGLTDELYKQDGLPGGIVKIKPSNQLLVESQIKQAEWNKIASDFNNGVHKQRPSVSPTASLSARPKGGKFIVPATDDDTIILPHAETVDLEKLTKEPVFAVTEGYTNVLVQGANNKRQKNSESRQSSSKSLKPKDNSQGSSYKSPSKSGSYKGTSKSDYSKPQGYFGRSHYYDDEDDEYDDENLRGKSALTKNYRDDKLHEPENSHESEREDFDKERVDHENERIKDDEEEEEEEEEEEDDAEEEEDDPKKKEEFVDKKPTQNEPKESNVDTEEGEEDEEAKGSKKESEKVVEEDEEAKSSKNESEKVAEEDDDAKSSQNQTQEVVEEDEEAKNVKEHSEEVVIPHSEHADPKPIPTKPIYPGEGLWAKRGMKHRPYVSQHKFINHVDNDKKPDGHDIFDNLEQFFESQKVKFAGNFKPQPDTPYVSSNQAVTSIKAPTPPNPLVVFDPFAEAQSKNGRGTFVNAPYHLNPNHINVAPAYNTPKIVDNEDEFIPTKIYAQVRNTEDVVHEPYKADEHGRLKEVIKDTKVQTLYSEEGFEDSAYDHAGHEKKAEEDKGYAEFGRKKEIKNPKPKKDSEAGHSKRVVISDNHLGDSATADSVRTSHVTPNHVKIDKGIPKTFSKSGNSTNFISSEENKMTQVTDKENGDIQLEIQSEVKMIVQPNNSTKAHKYVKIYPKILKDIVKETPTIETNSTETDSTKSTTPRSIESNAEKEEEDVESKPTKKSNKPKRIKRSVDEILEDVKVETDFIDQINHTFAPPEPPKDLSKKYPYYSQPDVNENSPLRYTENLRNVPVKRNGELSFYKKADRYECPDVPENVDPIPEHVKRGQKPKDEEDDEDEDEESEDIEDRHPASPKTPRIEVGDKIDCLKIRYFGDNPFDSPFFQETSVGPVKSLFNELERQSKQIKQVKPEAKSTKKENEVLKSDESEEPKGKETKRAKAESTAASSIDNRKASVTKEKKVKPQATKRVKKPTPVPTVSLITTPKYTIQLTPNNIYDQIKLLDHLPEEEEVTQRSVEAVTKGKKPSKRPIKRRDTNVDEKYRVANVEDIDRIQQRPTRLARKLEFQEEESQIDEVEPPFFVDYLRGIRTGKANFQMFDISAYLTTTPLSLLSEASNHSPKQKVLSEVFYKEQIKPSEQLNVFADVLNNIKEASNLESVSVPIDAAADFSEPTTETLSTLEIPDSANVRVKKFQSDSSNHKNLNQRESFGQKIHVKQNRNRHSRPVVTASPPIAISSPNSVTGSRKVLKKRRKPSISTTSSTTTTTRTTPNINVSDEKVPKNHQPYVVDYIDDIDNVIGLVPPQNTNYKTIVIPDLEVRDTNELAQTVTRIEVPVTEKLEEPPQNHVVNKYYFVGLKPPVAKRARPYSDFTSNNVQVNEKLLRKRVAHLGTSRTRREASKPAYAEVTRNKGTEATKAKEAAEAPDDYVPHRTRNWHYDENTGKIVYHNKSEKPKEEEEEGEEEEEEEEYEEIEVTDRPGIYLEKAEGATHPTPEKVTTKPLLATATPPPEGKGLLDFVVKLKNDPTYKHIADPTTAKPGSATEATKDSFVTVNPNTTSPPEFLNILSKVRTDKNYKPIDDPKESASKPKATTAKPEEDEEFEYVDDDDEGVKSSRSYRQVNLKTFDVGEFLPKIQTPTSSDIPTNFFQKNILERLFPRLKYMTPLDIAREYYRKTALYEFFKKLAPSTQKGPDLGSLEIFDIGGFLPTIAPIDYRKYKTIERPRVTPNFNFGPVPVDFSIPIGERNTGGEPAVQKLTEKLTTASPIAPPTRMGFTRRRPVKQSSSLGITPDVSASHVVETSTNEGHDKAHRQYRRRPVRIRPTTEKGSRRRRSIQFENGDNKNLFRAESLDDQSADTKDANEDVTKQESAKITDKDDKKTKYIVIINKNYDNTHKHGGNYRQDPESQQQDEGRDLKNDSEEKESQSVDKKADTEVVNKNYDKSKKHGGNYKEQNDAKDHFVDDSKQTDSESDKKKDDVEIMDEKYDKTKKHGGNYRKQEVEDVETDAVQSETHLALKNVNDTLSNERNTNTTINLNTGDKTKLNPVDVVKTNYDKNQKHGGNYKEDKASVTKKSSDVKKDVEVIKPYDKTKKHGGNYKTEQDAVIDELLEDGPIQTKEKKSNNTTSRRFYKTTEVRKISTDAPETVSRLSDIAPKPDHFYTDPQLPKHVNTLGSGNPAVPLQSEELTIVAAEGDLDDADEESDEDRIRRRYNGGDEEHDEGEDDEDEEDDNEEDDAEDKRSEETSTVSNSASSTTPSATATSTSSTTTEKPIFIKDPGKRLYFYAPI